VILLGRESNNYDANFAARPPGAQRNNCLRQEGNQGNCPRILKNFGDNPGLWRTETFVGKETDSKRKQKKRLSKRKNRARTRNTKLKVPILSSQV